MKLSLTVALLTLTMNVFASDIVTNHKDKVLSTASYTFTGLASVVQNDDGKFSTTLDRKLLNLDTSEISNLDIKENVELDLKNSSILDSNKVTQVNDSLFYKKLKLENAQDVIETAVVRQVISELATINHSAKLKHKIKIAKVKINQDLKCTKSFKKICYATYTVETILNTVE